MITQLGAEFLATPTPKSYVPFGVGFYSLTPAGPGDAKAALAQAGIAAPDVAVHRRVEAAVGLAGVAALIGGLLVVQARRVTT